VEIDKNVIKRTRFAQLPSRRLYLV